jgi:hypothetical protein
MTAPDPPKVSAKDATIQNLTRTMVIGGLNQLDAEQKARQKAADTHAALRRAVIWATIAMLFFAVAAFGVFTLARDDKGISILILVAIGGAVVGGVPLLIAGYNATQASSEFMQTYLGILTGTIAKVRGKKEDT